MTIGCNCNCFLLLSLSISISVSDRLLRYGFEFPPYEGVIVCLDCSDAESVCHVNLSLCRHFFDVGSSFLDFSPFDLDD
jgi:hypothetical protein